MWRRLTNRLYAGNGTNHGCSSGLCCSLFLCNSAFFSYISVLFTSLFLIALSLKLLPLFFTAVMNHMIGPHTPPLVLPQPLHSEYTPPIPPSTPPWVFPSSTFLTLSSPWFLIHWPPRFTQSTPLHQIIILSAVTKEMHTPSITMYKFSVRRFGRVLIKKPFHSFS